MEIIRDENGRTCSKCFEYKTYDNYYKEKLGYAGRSSQCKKCRNSDKRKWVEDNIERVLETRKDYYKENKETILAENKKWREDNKEYRSEYHKNYRLENIDRLRDYDRKRYYETIDYQRQRGARYRAENIAKLRENDRKRYERLKSLPHTITKEEIDELHTIFNGCSLSDEKYDIHLDHFIPLTTGYGGTIKGNILPMSGYLNMSKGSQNPFEWVKWKEGIDINKFDRAVEYLAELNGKSVDEFIAYVYSCFEKEVIIDANV